MVPDTDTNHLYSRRIYEIVRNFVKMFWRVVNILKHVLATGNTKSFASVLFSNKPDGQLQVKDI
jgi:hypothetical protein